MRYLLCDCSNPAIILLTLKQKGYSCSSRPMFLFDNYKILIDKEQKIYYILQNDKEAESIAKDNIIYYFTCEDIILKQLGAHCNVEELNTKIEDKITQLLGLTKGLKSSDIKDNPYITILDHFEKLCNETDNSVKKEKSSDIKDEFKAALLPGRIVELEVKGQRCLGFILTSGTVVYTNDQGQIKGYLNGFTMDHPYKVQKILIPATNCFQLKDYNKMQVAWCRPIETITVKKSVSEIEKELGLAPGTLEIY